jgi:hypothetical protein
MNQISQLNQPVFHPEREHNMGDVALEVGQFDRLYDLPHVALLGPVAFVVGSVVY